MSDLNLIGHILDGKYQMTSELGRGGMGTVYLANHVGTERPVAVKIIAPQFMKRPEFVERFRREARAAGRLRHPNVVDVTDFGFAETTAGQVAYLVMEYLDGCTLGEILDEEKNLPVAWSLDILEQVCSAVQEAHHQGIIHRDLKPDNIWLEPNQRGGYTVKVLDFGIAKLEENDAEHAEGGDQAHSLVRNDPATLADNSQSTFSANDQHTLTGESATIVQDVKYQTIAPLDTVLRPADDDGKATAIYDPNSDREIADQETVGTQMLPVIPQFSRSEATGDRPSITGGESISSSRSVELTRVGSLLGTPLYMSPEQCRGEHLDARSDIYSLGVIAYQMLSGQTPFSGAFKDVIDAHKTQQPPHLVAKKARRKLRMAIMRSLSKSPDDRPVSAEAFAGELRARQEGLGGLLRQAGMIYTEHFTKFLALTALFMLPAILFSVLLLVVSFLKAGDAIAKPWDSVLLAVLAAIVSISSGFGGYLNFATITWLVSQHLAIPLRPIRLRPALAETHRRWKSIFMTGLLTTIGSFVIGAITCGIGFLVTSVIWVLVGSVVMMEGLKGRPALRRSRQLVRRSIWTTIGVVLMLFLIPAVLAGGISFFVNATARGLDPTLETPVKISKNAEHDAVKDSSPDAEAIEKVIENESGEKRQGKTVINLGTGPKLIVSDDLSVESRIKNAVLESLIQILWLPVQILVLSFSAIIVALLYLKTRLAGGESMNSLLACFDNDDAPVKKWQERVRKRLANSGRSFSNT